MSTIENQARLAAGLRRTAIATIAALLIEYGLGLFLYGTTPNSAHGSGLLVAFGRSIANGPAELVIHVILGTLILVGGIMSLIRAIQTRRAVLIVLNGIAFIGILLAWLAGDATASDPMGPSGRVMGITAGIAILAYACALFIPSKRSEGTSASPRR